jgi:hypothetical protein
MNDELCNSSQKVNKEDVNDIMGLEKKQHKSPPLIAY